MSADRSSTAIHNSNRPLKPALASGRTARSPLTPRVAGQATTTTPATRPTLAKTATFRSEPSRVTPRSRPEDAGGKSAVAVGNVTPRSSARKSRAGSATPTQADDDSPSAARLKAMAGAPKVTAERSVRGPSPGSGGGMQSRLNKPTSLVNGNATSQATSAPLIRSPGHPDVPQEAGDASIESRFFHASDARRQEPVPKKAESKKGPTFFYADGKQEERKRPSPRTTSPVLSAVSEKRLSNPRIRGDGSTRDMHSPPILSPALSPLSSVSPFFAQPIANQSKQRSPSPSKENIHLSYRKGASQIFGTRPTQRPPTDIETIAEGRRPSLDIHNNITPHKKSPSLSSIDSGISHQSRRRSATTLEATPSPLNQVSIPHVDKPPQSIDTALDSPDFRSCTESARSPTKSISDLAADARRERKVLDLEISNSSLLAINASLEREIRRQKTELKRFRRLSRAGRLSTYERSARLSEGLSTLGEEDAEEDDADYSAFGPPSGFTDIYDDWSDDDETESLMSGGEPLSLTAQATRDSDRLAKDEKRLQVDLEKHKELLVQSQMMNQSIKRCNLATEEMIKDGKKALEYSVRVSNVKLGGRILTGHEGEEERNEIEVEDDTLHGERAAEDFLKVWQGLGRSVAEGSEGGDQDSGIEVDKPAFLGTWGGAQ